MSLRGAKRRSNLSYACVLMLTAIFAPACPPARAAEAPSADEVDRVRAEAHKLVSTGRYPEAATRFLEILKARPGDSSVYSDVATVYYMAGDYKTAAHYYRRAIELDPQQAKFHAYLGAALQMLNRNDEALTAYDKAVKLDPGDFRARFNRSFFLDHIGRTDEAAAEYEKLLAFKEDDGKLHYHYAEALFKQERLEDAWRHVQRSRELGYDRIEENFLDKLRKKMPEPPSSGAAPAPAADEEALKSYLKKNPPPQRS